MRSSTSLRSASANSARIARRLVALQVHEDRRDDLRMLVADQLGDGGGVHPLQAFDAARRRRLAGCGRAGRRPCRRRAPSSAPSGCSRPESRPIDVCSLACCVNASSTSSIWSRVTPLQLRHRLADLLHFRGPRCLQHLGGFVLAQRHQQDRAVVSAGVTHCGFTQRLDDVGDDLRILARELRARAAAASALSTPGAGDAARRRRGSAIDGVGLHARRAPAAASAAARRRTGRARRRREQQVAADVLGHRDVVRLLPQRHVDGLRASRAR